jgi:hypothetical protein
VSRRPLLLLLPPGRRCRNRNNELTKGRETGPSALRSGYELSDRKWFQVESKNADATAYDFIEFLGCAQAHTGHEFFALVESSSGG